MLIAIAALDPDRVIGRAGRIPWHLPDDLRLFRQLTTGHTVIMGRKTWDSLPRRPLPGRHNVVVTHCPSDLPEAVEAVAGLDALAPWIESPDPAFLIGGASLYEALLPVCTELVLTHVADRHPGDTWFPRYDDSFAPVEPIAAGEGWRTVRYRKRV